MTSIGAVAAYWMIKHYLKDNEDDDMIREFDPFMHHLTSLVNPIPTEAQGKAQDKYLDSAMNRLDDGIKDLLIKYPDMKRPMLSSGHRGTRYFIEFPVTGKNVDAFSILVSIQNVLNAKKKKVRVLNNDSFKQEDMISYLIDYDVPSATTPGSKNKGSIYIRGVKGEEYDSFKFVMEKNVDFHDIDIEIILKAYEEAFKPKMG